MTTTTVTPFDIGTMVLHVKESRIGYIVKFDKHADYRYVNFGTLGIFIRSINQMIELTEDQAAKIRKILG